MGTPETGLWGWRWRTEWGDMGINIQSAERNPKLAAAMTAQYKKRKPIPKLRHTSYANAKRKAWEAFSQFIRLRDSIATTGNAAICRCVTCNSIHPSFGANCIQAGHWLGGRAGKNLFEERAVHGQCVKCNKWLSGNNTVYTSYMTRTYGHEVCDEIIRQANTIYSYSLEELAEIREMYLLRCEALKRQG